MSQQTGEALFVLEEKAFVACVEVDGFDAAVCIETHGPHEAQGVRDSVHDPFVLFFDGWSDHMA